MVDHGRNGEARLPLKDPDADVDIRHDDGGGSNSAPAADTTAHRSRRPRVAGGSVRGAATGLSGGSKSARKAIEQQRERAVQRVIYPPDDEQFECTFPYFWEGLTMSAYSDGTARLPWEVAIRRIPGGYTATVTDHDLLQRLSAQAVCWEEIPQAVELKLTSANPGWEPMEKSYRNKKGLDKFKKKT